MKKAQKAAAEELSREVAGLLAGPLQTISSRLDLSDPVIESAWAHITTAMAVAVRVYAKVDPKVVAAQAILVETDALIGMSLLGGGNG